MLKGKCIQFLSMQHIRYLCACFSFSKSNLGQPLRIHSSSTVSHLVLCASILCRAERNILADIQISQVGSVLGGELMSSIVSSIVVIRLTVGPYQFVTDAYRSHSDILQQGGRHRKKGGGRDLISYDGVKRLV